MIRENTTAIILEISPTLNKKIPKTSPINTPVHLAHTGNCFPRKEKLRSGRSSYHHKFLIYFSFIHHHLTLQNVLRSDRQKSVYRLKKALKILYNSKFPVSFLLLKYPKYYTLTVCLYPRITDSKNITARKLPL